MRRAIVCSWILGLALTSGCADAPMAKDAVVETAASDDVSKAAEAAVEDRMVVRTARLELRSEDPSAAAAELTRLADAMGGYVASSDASGVGDDLARVDATLRIPADRFEEALAAVRGEGEVLREGVEGKDVTEEYSDIEAQLRSQKALEERMLAILAKTEKVDDALTVEKELVRVRSTIETLEGRRKLLAHQVSMATIEVAVLNPTQANAPASETALSRLDRSVDDAGDVFIGVVGGLIRLLGGLLPIFLIGGPIAFAAHRGFKRRRARQPKPSPRPAPPTYPPAGPWPNA